MAFDNLAAFFAMGTHGVYVWSAYALALIAIIGIHIYVIARRRRLEKTLKNLKKYDETH